MTSEKTNSNSKTILVVGASGNTGFPLVKQLLARGYKLRIIVRSLDKFPRELLENSKLKIIKASFLDLSDEQMLEAVKGCGAVASCLGHTMSFKGMFGKPRTLVLEAVKRLCVAITATRSADKTKFLLMNTVGNRNPGERVTTGERFILSLLRNLIPPHYDNEASAAFLRDSIGSENEFIEWVVVRPDGLINAEISNYEVVATPPRTIFNGLTTTRANVAHFMCDCIEQPNLWFQWKGKMPVVFNKKIK